MVNKNFVKELLKKYFSVKCFLFAAVISLTCLIAACNTDNDKDFGAYYNGTFIDFVNILSESDTVNIVLEQLGSHFQKQNVPYTFETNNNDTVKIKLFVSFGSYNQQPEPVKNVKQISDTFYVWYSLVSKTSKTINKSSTITEVSTSPKVSYVSVDSLVIGKTPDQVIHFISRLLH